MSDDDYTRITTKGNALLPNAFLPSYLISLIRDGEKIRRVAGVLQRVNLRDAFTAEREAVLQLVR